MIKNTGRGLWVSGAALFAALVATGSSAQQEYRSIVSINEVMVFLIDHNSHAIWDVASTPPESEDDWHLLEHSALAIAASGNLTNIGGTGPNDWKWAAESEWRAYSLAMADAGLSALNAVRAKDVEALLSAGDDLLNSCIACHRQYKPELPSVTAQPHMHRP